MRRRRLAAAAIWATGLYQPVVDLIAHRSHKKEEVASVAPPSVTVSRVTTADFVESVLVTGSLIAREEVLVAPEVEGLRILELRADQGDKVKKGDVLAVLETITIDAQLAQNAANLERSTAAIAQAKSQITEVQARLTEAKAQLERAEPLSKQGYLSGSTLDARTASKRSLEALLVAANGGLRAAEADKVQLEAARRELEWRRSRADVRAPSAASSAAAPPTSVPSPRRSAWPRANRCSASFRTAKSNSTRRSANPTCAS